MSQNQAAWLTAPKTKPFEVGPAPMPKPGPGQIVIKNHAVAVNPADWKNQDAGYFIKEYPTILGIDAAGTIEEVGEGVTRFSKGQRVMAHFNQLKEQDPAQGSFQLYAVAYETYTSAIPDSMSFEEASVLPLAISTAASGLYLPKYLGISELPSESPKPSTNTVLIWGGASSVGATAIQLAAASGLKVITTASPANHDFVKAMGASVVLDYRSPSVVEDIVRELKDTPLAGIYDAISEDASFSPILDIVTRLNTTVKVVGVLPYKTPTENFSPTFVFGYDISHTPHEKFGEAVWGEFIPKALASGQLQAKPHPLVVGHGLDAIQHGLDVQKAGVSAKKVVVTL
ncbi:chaperonin 10-like protein [Aspergillus avenaceus]|uniref:Chaperonin 10-like protein n=1 Tax=Aspergillus avenaceus TaxID=36643 RepID=A0A5N6UA04_ASPAV|nr:chaperonin 10-like protein [Aspergillus avenaceus]